MKGNKTIAILLGVLAVLVGAGLVREYAMKPKTEETGYTLSLPKLTAEAIDRVTLEGENGTVTLTKTNGRWQVDGLVADSKKINGLVSGLLKPTKTELIAETSARHEALGVASGSGVLITLGAGETLGEWWLGRSGDEGEYVRPGMGDRVYQVVGLPSLASSTDKADWLEKTIATIAETDIEKVTMVRPNGANLVLVRQGADWFEEGKETALDPEPITPMSASLAALVTQGLVEDEATWPKQPVVTVTIKTKAGEETLSWFRKGEEYAVRTASRPGLFAITKEVFDGFNLQVIDLKPKPAPTPTGTTE